MKWNLSFGLPDGVVADVFSAESATLRAQAAAEANGPLASLHVDAARVFVNDAAMRVEATSGGGMVRIEIVDPQEEGSVFGRR